MRKKQSRFRSRIMEVNKSPGLMGNLAMAPRVCDR